LNIQNGTGDQGGAILNRGTLTVSECAFSGNSANAGGAILNSDTLTITGCTFSSNNASTSGGAIDNEAQATCSCSRIVNNTAVSGNAIYNRGNFIATNNWWGTNTPDTATNLFYGTVDYTPWITMSFSADPSTITPGGKSAINLTFSSACIPVTPVGFSTTEGTLTATLANTVDGIATTTLIASYSGLSFTASVTVGPDEEAYSLYLTVTPDPIIPGISITKKINDSVASTQEPGVVVASDSMMDIRFC
jgi:hypothetical protein